MSWYPLHIHLWQTAAFGSADVRVAGRIMARFHLYTVCDRFSGDAGSHKLDGSYVPVGQPNMHPADEASGSQHRKHLFSKYCRRHIGVPRGRIPAHSRDRAAEKHSGYRIYQRSHRSERTDGFKDMGFRSI